MNKIFKLFFYIFISSLILVQTNYAQVCTMPDSVGTGPESNTYPLFGPTGTLKILVVVCKFSDDNYNKSPNTDLWPSALNQMPAWAPSILSPTVQPNYSDPSFSGYFQDMSLNQLNVIGDVVFYQPIHEQSYYFMSSGRHIGYLSEEILTSINSQVNYANYDSWDPLDMDSDGIKNESDGQVDFIAICFRFASTENLDGSGYEGIAGLTGYRGTFINGQQLILDGKIISAKNLLSGFGSGTFQQSFLSLDNALHVMTHEFGHYLFGTTHFEGLGFHGMMDGMGTGVMSSYERIKMTWFDPIPVNNYAPDISIPDAISTGVVYKIEIPYSSDYFLVDNHLRISYYESQWLQYNGGPLTSPGTGLLITQVPQSGDPDIESAYGKWDWEREWHYWPNQNLHWWLYTYPYKRLNTNRVSGEDKLNLRSKPIDPDDYSIKANHSDYLGASDDFFNVDYNQVFSPWSNPSTYPDNANLCVQILQKDQFNNMHVNFYTTNAVTAPPSKPQNLKSSVTSDYHPKLTWDKNLEPDMTQYKVYRSYSPTTNFTQIGTATHNPFLQTITYIDYTIDVPQNPHQRSSPVYYRVTAVDNQSLESVKSDYVQAISDELIDWKSSGNSNTNETPSVFSLTQNYPNPFNPTTTISFSIPERSFVTLKVYDMLGREVAELVNEELETGSIEKTFDANALSSGVYIYRITAMKDGKNLFNESKQMILIK